MDRRRPTLRSAQHGAMMLMGIPLVFLMIGMLYFVVGIGEEIVRRERLQDAADAAAFSAAIMHARGMNMIALVNQVMAAIVALLVMVRLLQALMLAVVAIAGALAFFTAGASLAVVPPAAQAANQAQQAFEQLKNVTTPILRGLHVFELGIKYGMPVAAEARVVDTVAGPYSPPARVGFAIPGSYPLPVKEGNWPELCEKAGEYAGEMIMFPVNAIIGDNPVSDHVGSGIGALAKSFSGLFCGDGGLSIPEELPEIRIDRGFTTSQPTLPSLDACKSSDSGISESEREDRCEQAAIDEARSRPGPDGRPNTECSYLSPRDQTTHSCEPCADVSGEPCAEFDHKASSAARICGPGGSVDADTWSYQRREYAWRAELVPVPLVPDENGELVVPEPEARRYTIEFTTREPEHADRFVADDGNRPCGGGGHIGSDYNARAVYKPDGSYGPGELLCEQDHYHPDVDALIDAAGEVGLALTEWRAQFDDPRWTETLEPYTPEQREDDEDDDQGEDDDERARPARLVPPFVPEERPVFVGQWSAVTYLHSCGTNVESLDQVGFEPPAAAGGAQQEPADGGACGQGDQVHHEMEPGHALGSETFQLRAVVIAQGGSDRGREIVRKMPMRLRGQDRDGSAGLEFTADVVSRLYVAQAEYYFDTRLRDGSDELEIGEDQWLWNMGWRARLRRVRLPREEPEQDERQAPSREEVGGCDFAPPLGSVGESCASAGGGEECPDDGVLGELRELAESVMVH